MKRCPYGDCTFEGTEAEVDDHVTYVTSFDDPDHRTDKLRGYDDEGPDYDEVIAVAKEMWGDPYDAHGEYKPAVISAAIAEIERRKEAQA